MANTAIISRTEGYGDGDPADFMNNPENITKTERDRRKQQDLQYRRVQAIHSTILRLFIVELSCSSHSEVYI